MNDGEHFEAYKKDLVQKNKDTYEEEARQKWGDDAVDASNRKFLSMTAEEFASQEACEEALRREVLAALEDGDPDGSHAMRAAMLHASWLKRLWPNGFYSPDKHIALAQGYLMDERFKAYYDAWTLGACAYLVGAIERTFSE